MNEPATLTVGSAQEIASSLRLAPGVVPVPGAVNVIHWAGRSPRTTNWKACSEAPGESGWRELQRCAYSFAR